MSSEILLVMLLDERACMKEKVWYEDALSEFNFILEDFKTKTDFSTRVIFIKFDTQPTVVLDCVDINDVPLLTSENYNPNGDTPFFNSLEYALDAAAVAKNEAEEVHFAIFTNGYNLSSVGNATEETGDMIELFEEYGWRFYWQIIKTQELGQLIKMQCDSRLKMAETAFS